jgi:peptidoglycan/LPS O-acetylase OafA/YrhL
MRPAKHEPALDGVRGVAILGVLFSHFGLLPGGAFGVDAFFVLSGFLITSLLLGEWQATGTISLRLFYTRRALRLFPALGALLVIVLDVGLMATFVGGQSFHQLQALWQGIGFGAFYAANIAKAAGLNLASLTHLWSLAEEEQFYLLWPIALLTCLRRRIGPSRLCLLLTLAALLVAGNRLALFSTGATSWERLISSPDTRSDPLLVGCLAGVLYSCRLLPSWSRSRGAGWLWLPSAATVAAVVASFGRWPHWAYTVGLVPFELAIAILILVALTHRDSLPSRVLQVRPLTATGKISYSLYLWHVLFRTQALLLAFALSFAAATASYRFIERPFLRKKAKRHPVPMAEPEQVETRPTAPAPATVLAVEA